ncbi:MAG: AMP-binding protein [Bacteroidetes bacterium]|nr:AMP-binding protein [Bacteroidota bacterium]
MSQFDWFSKWNIYTPDKIAFKELESGRKFTFKEMNTYSSSIANILQTKYSIKKGDRVGILAENCVEFYMLLGAAQKTGIVILPLNYRLTANELDFIISDGDPSLIIYEDIFFDKLNNTNSFKKVSQKLSLVEFRELLTSDVAEYIGAPVEADDTALLLYTAGTTAFPKGAYYTHGMMFWNSLNSEIRLDITSEDRSITATPAFHTGFWNVLASPFIHHGAYTLIVKNFDSEKVLQALEDEEATIWWAVPTMLKMMSDSPLFDEVKLTNLRYFIVGGEAMPIPLIEKWHKKGVLIRQGYGLTEVGPNVTSLNAEHAVSKQGSIGTPNFYINTKLVDDKGNEVIGEGTGELLLNGPNVTPGYWKNEEATKETITDGWFHTGDVVKRDVDGFLFVVDRIKNMYISGGENVYPVQVECVIREHPKVDDVAIIGVPDEKWGETGKAFVVLKKNETFTLEEMTEYCLDKLAKYKIPKHLEIIDELPKNVAGKIDRKRLHKGKKW